ncbi:MAG TPA: CopG family transcriptional regulator [Candidatus Binatia bacterium]|nr:CopG family transcriptional regulator [Candidatus Binatia bacterium]
MKNITVSVDDEVYHAARVEAAKRRTSLSALVSGFLAGLQDQSKKASKRADPELEKLWALADSKPIRPGSVGPLNREELYQRGVRRY